MICLLPELSYFTALGGKHIKSIIYFVFIPLTNFNTSYPQIPIAILQGDDSLHFADGEKEAHPV